MLKLTRRSLDHELNVALRLEPILTKILRTSLVCVGMFLHRSCDNKWRFQNVTEFLEILLLTSFQYTS